MTPLRVGKKAVMHLFHRKSAWERTADKVTSTVSGAKPGVKTGAAAAAGMAVMTVGSAAISALRKKGAP